MAYGNYAPFYRGGYFNPMQTTPIQQIPMQGNQQMIDNQQYIPQYQQIQTTQPTNEMIWVLNENEATSYPVAPNNNVVLWDKNSQTIYIKSVDGNGVPSMRILDFTERTQNASKSPVEHVCQCNKDFVHIDDFKALEAKFEDLTAKVEDLKPKTTKSKKTEDNE